MSVNKVILIGNLGRDLEVRFTKGGNAVVNMRLACTESLKRQGKYVEVTEWVDVVCFGKLAENAGKYLAKGRQVYVEGRLQTRKWQDRDGRDRWSTEVVCNKLVYLQGGGTKTTNETVKDSSRPSGEPVDDGFYDDDMPF